MSLCINPHCSHPENQDTILFCESCGSELLLDGRYRVIKELGGGGFGKTYEVQDRSPTNPNSDKTALKVLKVLLHNHPKYVELFEREAQFLTRFDHPGIPKVDPDAYFTFYLHNSNTPIYCLVMEKIEGLNLRQYVSQRGKCISQKLGIQWLMQLLRILQEIHQHNFFHRDIKPSNIMLRADGQLVLIDFGTAREVTETYLSKQSAGEVTGLFSAGYSPPEQLNGQAIPQSDFFALGRTFVYLLTGKHPSDLYNSQEDELYWRDAVPDLVPELGDLLDRIMARVPSQRPQSAASIIRVLEVLYHNLYGIDNFLTRPPDDLPSQPGDDDAHWNAILDTPTRVASNTQSKPSVPPPMVPLPLPPKADDQSFITHTNELDPQFINRCQEELAELIGPMASLICQKTFKKNPNLSEADFIKALSAKIPDPEKAEQFQQRFLA
ncbi:serine/threonine protein kinase [Aphanothece sacrum]|uniref:non-specific serine/threonine protein kinase n=1 Tax=Aphanothece sacrum FPU1 TaxID=1920663 RepID=A0A401IIP6_APHSA|nr:serine/threonine-protein kinase [Aphanothece sacrum]GBF81129.1 protein kinase [Aphanothece sacrum FPU1]GBF86215.1 protein kinase [Aphanothece sacrum FPU3]